MNKTEALSQYKTYLNKGFKPQIMQKNEDYQCIISPIFLKAYQTDGYKIVEVDKNIVVSFESIKDMLVNNDLYLTLKNTYALNVRYSKYNTNNGLIMINDVAVSCIVAFAQNFLVINYIDGQKNLQTLQFAYIECEF
jgi:hypothetical protein